MDRASRITVELLLWLGAVAGLALLLIWWDVRPGSAVDYRPEQGDATSLFTDSFLFITATTALVLWLRAELPLARLASAVVGLALLLGGGSWNEIEGGGPLGLALRLGGVLLGILVIRSTTWEQQERRAGISRRTAVVLLVVLVPVVGYLLLVLVVADVELYPAPVVPALALLAWALRLLVTDLVVGVSRRAPRHED